MIFSAVPFVDDNSRIFKQLRRALVIRQLRVVDYLQKTCVAVRMCLSGSGAVSRSFYDSALAQGSFTTVRVPRLPRGLALFLEPCCGLHGCVRAGGDLDPPALPAQRGRVAEPPRPLCWDAALLPSSLQASARKGLCESCRLVPNGLVQNLFLWSDY